MSPGRGAVPLPLVIRAAPAEDASALVRRLAEETAWINEKLLRHGALLYRNFGVLSDAQFEPVCRALSPELKLYVEGNSPRDHTSAAVYTATNYPSEFDISMHSELSYAHTPPQRLFFYCATPPVSGGETPLVDCRRVLELLDSAVLQRFEERGVRYVQNMHGGAGLGRSWQETFETTERAEVDAYLARSGVRGHWSDAGDLRTEQCRPAVRKHPFTGERVWFNQADQWHPTNLDEDTRMALSTLLDEKDYPLNAVHGDGSPIAPEDLNHIREVMWEAAVAFPWEAGDVLVIDNYYAAHGRRAYTGERIVRVAMG